MKTPELGNDFPDSSKVDQGFLDTLGIDTYVAYQSFFQNVSEVLSNDSDTMIVEENDGKICTNIKKWGNVSAHSLHQFVNQGEHYSETFYDSFMVQLYVYLLQHVDMTVNQYHSQRLGTAYSPDIISEIIGSRGGVANNFIWDAIGMVDPSQEFEIRV